jgi:hypothetical protein
MIRVVATMSTKESGVSAFQRHCQLLLLLLLLLRNEFPALPHALAATHSLAPPPA